MGKGSSKFDSGKFVGTFNGALKDKYVIEKQLGAGAQGAAYLVKSIASGQEFVAKETHDMSPEGKEEFLEEFEKMRALRHPNITKVVECVQGREFIDNEWKDQIFVISELARGSDLYKYMKKAIERNRRNMTEEWVAGVFKQAMQGVAYIHSQGIVHNDLKPDNILMMEEFSGYNAWKIPYVAINDFGCATLKKDQGFRSGDPRYQSPESWRVMMKMIRGEDTDAKKLGPAADIWSMAATLYELLSGGVLPFVYKEATLHDILNDENGLLEEFGNAIINDEVKVEPYCKGISPEGKALLESMFVKEPEKRLSAAEVLKHKWFQIKGKPIDAAVSTKLKVATSKGVAHRIMLNALASKLQRKHYQACFDVFNALDADQSGHIDIYEFREGLTKLGKSTQDADKTFQQADIDKSGHLDFPEFLAATFDWKSLDQKSLENNLRTVFSDLDKDGSGELEQAELIQLFEGAMSKQEIKDVFSRIDKDGNGKVSVREMSHFLFEPPTEEDMSVIETEEDKDTSSCEMEERIFTVALPIAVGGYLCFEGIKQLLL